MLITNFIFHPREAQTLQDKGSGSSDESSITQTDNRKSPHLQKTSPPYLVLNILSTKTTAINTFFYAASVSESNKVILNCLRSRSLQSISTGYNLKYKSNSLLNISLKTHDVCFGISIYKYLNVIFV